MKKIEKSRKKHDDEDDWGKTRELPDRPGIVRSSSWSPSILLMTNKSRTKRTKDVDELTSTIIALGTGQIFRPSERRKCRLGMSVGDRSSCSRVPTSSDLSPIRDAG